QGRRAGPTISLNGSQASGNSAVGSRCSSFGKWERAARLKECADEACNFDRADCKSCTNGRAATMFNHDQLTRDLFTEIVKIPLIDPHSHIDPHKPTARSLDDILGYHYYTELAHSAGMDKGPLSSDTPPRERVAAVLGYLDRLDNTVQYSWFLEIARVFLGFRGDRVGRQDADALCNAAERVMSQPDWEGQVLQRSNIERVFLTNDFDDPLQGFDAGRYVPCLRTDDLVFHLGKPETRQRLSKATGVGGGDAAALRRGVGKLFEHFTRRGAKACAISLPPDFSPFPISDNDLSAALQRDDLATRARGVFWMLAEFCREYRLPFDLMIGVNRRVY